MPPTPPHDPLRRALARVGRVTLDVVSRPAVPGVDARFPRKGVALLMVLTYLAMMSALVVTNFFNSQVTLSIASNHRDELKAYYKARSAMNLSRLILSFQYDLEKDPELAKAMRNSRFQVYQITDLLLEPFKSGAITLEGENGESVVYYDLQGGGTNGLGDDSGNYQVQVVPEEGRININRLGDGANNKIAIFDLCMLFMSPQYDAIFDERNDETGVKAERIEVISAIIDWIDDDNDRTLINDKCEIEGGSGDEDGRYNRGGVGPNKRDYKNKNGAFTTLDELFLVHGVTDDFMDAFRDSLTIYPVDKINVNIATARVFYALLCNAVDIESLASTGFSVNEGSWACNIPQIGSAVLLLAIGLEGYQQFVNSPLLLLSYYLQGNPEVIPGITPRGTVVPFRAAIEFKKVLQALQLDALQISRFIQYSPTAYQMLPDMQLPEAILPLVPQVKFNINKLTKNITAEGPKIFRITAIGEYAGTQKSLEAVVEISRQGEKFLYWREY